MKSCHVFGALTLFAVTLSRLQAGTPPPSVSRNQEAAAAKLDGTSRFHQLMMESMVKMDRGMMTAPMTGDPDWDFVGMMIPHHQGAIDMAKPYLLVGKDPALRRLA